MQSHFHMRGSTSVRSAANPMTPIRVSQTELGDTTWGVVLGPSSFVLGPCN